MKAHDIHAIFMYNIKHTKFKINALKNRIYNDTKENIM